MSFKKIQLLAQIVGFLTIGLLSIFGALSIAGDTSPAWAALGQASPSMNPRVPNVINYQGMLRQADGSVINGTYNMTFRLYDSPTGGTPVHTETLTGVVVRDGLFTVLLGDAADNPIQAAAFQEPLYVGIQVAEDAEMQPRQRIAPVPYAVQLTDGVYVDESGNVGIGTTSPEAGLEINKDSTNDPALLLNSSGLGWGSGVIFKNTAPAGHSYGIYAGNDGNWHFSDNEAQQDRLLIEENGDINVYGHIKANEPLVKIIRFYNLTAGKDGSIWNTLINSYEWDCVAASWAIRNDIDEYKTGWNGVWTYAYGGDQNTAPTWWVYAHLAGSGDKKDDTLDVDVLCFRKEITTWDGRGESNYGPPWEH